MPLRTPTQMKWRAPRPWPNQNSASAIVRISSRMSLEVEPSGMAEGISTTVASSGRNLRVASAPPYRDELRPRHDASPSILETIRSKTSDLFLPIEGALLPPSNRSTVAAEVRGSQGQALDVPYRTTRRNRPKEEAEHGLSQDRSVFAVKGKFRGARLFLLRC